MDDSSINAATQLLCEMTGRKHAVLVGRASAAIWAALRSRGIRGRWVLMPANICYIVAWAVLQSDNLPYLVDIDPSTGNISPETLDRVKVDSPAALIICHMYGLGAPIAALVEWAKARGVCVIEDAALALGATVADRPAGAWGDFSLFSFGPGKIVDVGTGGAMLTDDGELARQVQAARDAMPAWSKHLEQLNDEWTELYWVLHRFENQNASLATLYPRLFQIFGDITRYQMPAPHAERLVRSLSRLKENLAHRAEMASLFDSQLASMPVRTIPRPLGHVLWRYPLWVSPEDRNALLENLWENGILASRWYPSLGPMLSALAPDIRQEPLPGADQLAREIINLPVDESINEDSVERTAQIIQAYFQSRKRRKWSRRS